jgi:hypothetical protein
MQNLRNRLNILKFPIIALSVVVDEHLECGGIKQNIVIKIALYHSTFLSLQFDLAAGRNLLSDGGLS